MFRFLARKSHDDANTLAVLAVNCRIRPSQYWVQPWNELSLEIRTVVIFLINSEESHCKAVFSQYASRDDSQEVPVKVHVRVINGSEQVIRHFSRKRQASSACQLANSVMRPHVNLLNVFNGIKFTRTGSAFTPNVKLQNTKNSFGVSN